MDSCISGIWRECSASGLPTESGQEDGTYQVNTRASFSHRRAARAKGLEISPSIRFRAPNPEKKTLSIPVIYSLYLSTRGRNSLDTSDW